MERGASGSHRIVTTILALLSLWTVVTAQERRERLEERVEIPRSLRLEAVRIDEIVPHASVTAVPDGRFESVWVNTRITRRIDSLWRVPFDRRSRRNVQVDFDVRGPNGLSGHLEVPGSADSRIRVEVEPTPPRVETLPSGRAYLTGGAILHFDLGSAREAGQYSGVLTVSINQL